MSSEKGKRYGLMHNGEIEICTITKNDLEAALDVLDRSFFINESVCKGTEINLPESHQARKELRQLCKIAADDGVSLMARHILTNKIVAIAFNKIQYTDDDECFFVKFRNDNCKSPKSISLMDYMITMDGKIDVFKLYNIDCLLEIMFLATLPEFECKQIGRTLCKYSIDLAKDLQNGIGVDVINPKLKEKRPKAVSALFTSSYSQKIGTVLGFEVLNVVPYSEFSFNGKTYADRIGPIHTDSAQVALKF